MASVALVVLAIDCYQVRPWGAKLFFDDSHLHIACLGLDTHSIAGLEVWKRACRLVIGMLLLLPFLSKAFLDYMALGDAGS